MKKLILDTVCFFCALLFILYICFALCGSAGEKIAHIEELLGETPAPEGFAALRADPDASRLLAERCRRICEETEKAGETLAFFNHYDAVNHAQNCAHALLSAVCGDEPSDYASARSALFEALGSLARINSIDAEIFL